MEDGGERVARSLDLRGLKCPLPALKTAVALRMLASGELLRVEATDPLAKIDIPHCAGQHGAKVEGVEDRDGIVVFLLRAK